MNVNSKGRVIHLTELLSNAQRLPSFNWNYSFFGSHLQDVKQGWYYPKEIHTVFEVIYVQKGIEKIEYDSISYLIHEGEFTVISPNTSHRCKALTDLRYFTFHFDLDDPSLEELLIGNPKLVYKKNDPTSSKITARMDKMILNLDNKADNFDFSDRIEIQIQLSLIISDLYNSIKKININVNLYNVQYAKRIRYNIKQEMLSLVNQADHSKPFQSTDIIHKVCNELNLSIGYASKIFRESYSMSPKAYLSRVKQQIAQNLLLKPQYSISDISSLLGYKNAGNFSRQFKIWTGYSPNQFRSKDANYFLDKKLFSENFITYNDDPTNDVYRSFDN